MVRVVEVKDLQEKMAIAKRILEGLPNWFGIPESTSEYVAKSKQMPFLVAIEGGQPIGFVAIKEHSAYSAEVYVMGIKENYHRKGIGKMMIEKCFEFCKENGLPFLQVKTLAETHPDPYYARTRAFYTAMGFRTLEVFQDLWDSSNPCLMMIKYID